MEISEVSFFLAAARIDPLVFVGIRYDEKDGYSFVSVFRGLGLVAGLPSNKRLEESMYVLEGGQHERLRRTSKDMVRPTWLEFWRRLGGTRSTKSTVLEV